MDTFFFSQELFFFLLTNKTFQCVTNNEADHNDRLPLGRGHKHNENIRTGKRSGANIVEPMYLVRATTNTIDGAHFLERPPRAIERCNSARMPSRKVSASAFSLYEYGLERSFRNFSSPPPLPVCMRRQSLALVFSRRRAAFVCTKWLVWLYIPAVVASCLRNLFRIAFCIFIVFAYSFTASLPGLPHCVELGFGV